MKFTTLTQVNERAADGRVLAAMDGSTRYIDDADTDMVNLARSMAARGLITIDDDPEPEAGEGPSTLEIDNGRPDDPDSVATAENTGADEAAVDELASLRAEAEAAGVKVDGRWGPDRLRDEIAARAADEAAE